MTGRRQSCRPVCSGWARQAAAHCVGSTGDDQAPADCKRRRRGTCGRRAAALTRRPSDGRKSAVALQAAGLISFLRRKIPRGATRRGRCDGTCDPPVTRDLEPVTVCQRSFRPDPSRRVIFVPRDRLPCPVLSVLSAL